MVAALIVPLTCMAGTADPGALIVTWPLALLWFVLRAQAIVRGRTGLLLWLVLPALQTMLFAMQPDEPSLPLFAAGAGVAAFAVDGALSRGDALGLRFLFTVPAGGLLTLGGWMFTANFVDMVAGHHWSAWFDSPYNASQYPPTTRDALLWSLPLLGGGAACAALRWWSVRAATE